MQMTNEEHKTDGDGAREPKKTLSMVAIATLVFLLLAANCSCGVFAGGGDEGAAMKPSTVIERKM